MFVIKFVVVTEVSNMTEPTWWDATISKEIYPDQQVIIDVLDVLGADRYAIGDEIGEGGYEHWQVRVVFKKPKSLKQLVHDFPRVHWNPTSDKGRNFAYCEKEGKFYRSWEKVLNKFATLPLKKWQAHAITKWAEQDDRKILVIVDKNGGNGKTTLAKIMQARHEAQYCPQMERAEDYMAFAMAKPSKGYFIDVPRAEDYKKKKALWSAIEQIKNGYLYDKRYNYRDMWIDPPRILVTANEFPPHEALSLDRWEVHELVTWGGETWMVKHDRWWKDDTDV